MSSNIEIIRICEFCHREFVAKTTVTKYCSHRCNSRAYKAKVKDNKIQKSNAETIKIKTQAFENKVQEIELIKTKDFLTVKDITKLINCSRQSVYKMIKSGRLRTINIEMNKIIVERSDLDKLFSYE
ncbi:helix-turn-helix domain-containing protein [Zhouia spongiae]|uniref:Helix-turn-helix domain-containing protein n=1 Tax=Zhouia spongiae TaxID=2202721 RepID=A0ABY3YJM0_9FLAO|nr:helix-turn-helix domain-containing protein [Zhouia spongiae]UNY97768.1 helix-turn-helix domain-containing protein [Zhouia spongiae]